MVFTLADAAQDAGNAFTWGTVATIGGSVFVTWLLSNALGALTSSARARAYICFVFRRTWMA